MDKTSKDEAFEVADSTDWLETPLKSLSAVDAAMRCQVCRDFYTTPMITSCSHTFCSLCIRRSLNNDGKCPACRSPEQEMKLRNNNAMEDLVEAFKRGRADILVFARTPTSLLEAPSRKRSLEQAEEEVEDSSSKRRRSGRTKSSQKEKVQVVADSEEDGDGDGEYILEDGTAECPICQRRVKMAGINKHIDDGCPDEPQPFPHITKPGSRNSKGSAKSPTSIAEKPIKRPERLPQLNYSIVKDNVLKKRLTEWGISAAGNRQLLEKRCWEWITLWNANCDATKPKSKGELKRELEIWERTQGGRAATSSSTQMGAIIRDKEFDRDAWSDKHNGDFKQLIADAKRKAQAKKAETSSASTPAESARTATPNVAPTTTADVVMAEDGDEEPILIEDPPEKPASQKRFFDESNSDAPPSSQYQNKLDILDNNVGLAEDITTVRAIQP